MKLPLTAEDVPIVYCPDCKRDITNSHFHEENRCFNCKPLGTK